MKTFSSYRKVAEAILASASELTHVQATGYGTVEQLKAFAHTEGDYPLVWVRPMPSAGVQFETEALSTRKLRFMMYVLDINSGVEYSQTQMLDTLGNMENLGYNVLTEFYDGDRRCEFVSVNMSQMVPMMEAFDDKYIGWTFDIIVETQQGGITSFNR